jgi:hypothetical protein
MGILPSNYQKEVEQAVSSIIGLQNKRSGEVSYLPEEQEYHSPGVRK